MPGSQKECYCRIDVISELKCMQKMPSVPNKIKRSRLFDVTDEAVINESNCIEKIYERFQTPFGLK